MSDTPTPTTVLVPKAQAKQLAEIEELRAATRGALVEAEEQGQDVLKGMILAKAMQRLRDLLTPALMEDVMALQNSHLGFDTDRPAENPYGVEVVRDCAIVALLSGFQITGNEWNIISGRFYPAQKGCKRLVETWPGLHDLVVELGVPVNGAGGALVAATATWAIGTRVYQVDCHAANPEGSTAEQRMDTRLAIRVNKGQGTDAILGKARRKLYARVLERLTGVSPDDLGKAPTEEPARLAAAEPRGLGNHELDHQLERCSEVLDSARSLLQGAKNLTTCNHIAKMAEDALAGLRLPDHVKADAKVGIEVALTERMDAISASRGEGSNNAE